MTVFEWIDGADAGGRGLLFLCDHASNALPPGYGALGLAPHLLHTHIAYDIGAARLTRALAAHFGCPAVLGGFSRLLIDLNRGEDDPTLVMKLSDGAIIPGNACAEDAEIARRIRDFHAPYHDAVTRASSAIRARGLVPVPVSLHSFTPVWKGQARVWEMGVLWDRDDRLAAPLLARLRAAGINAGDNEPYSGALAGDCLSRHGTAPGYPHVLIETRQDLIADDARADAFAVRLAPILAAALADMGPALILDSAISG